jgi:hypothetical protein
MVQINLSPAHDLGIRLRNMEQNIAKLSTRDVLQYATFGADGTTVPQAFAQIQAQQATLNAQQATLTAQVAAIAAVVNAQVTADTGHTGASGYALGTSGQELCRITFTVPSGYTQALVLGSTTISIANQSSTSADFLRGYVDVNGTSSTPSPVFVPPLQTGQASNARSVVMTGLTAGSTYFVRAVAYTQMGVTGAASGTYNICNLDAQVIYLR